ncbi:hypothetical protein F4778DRAFT_769796 [Xylariomycetidae sp. FL2044]|nr:hypothetical protein F4778DRAFT_769796 [Xylariomycetidae sp. FL2044]
MSFMNGQHPWLPPPSQQHHINGNRSYHFSDDAAGLNRDVRDNSVAAPPEASASASDIDEDRQRVHFAELYRRSESKISQLFREDGSYNYDAIQSFKRPRPIPGHIPPSADFDTIEQRPAKRLKRVIDEDDYGDDEEEDEDGNDDEEAQPDATKVSPLKSRSGAAASKGLLSPSKSGSSPVPSVTSPDKPLEKSKEDGSQGSQAQANNSEDARKQLEEARKATEESAKRSFHTIIYTLENDRAAMLEQQQLEESEKQLQAEMDKNTHNNTSGGPPGGNHGSLSSANLGASSLTLKHLIARIDMKRDMVRASDAELRSLMNEVRKNRSKWASEENVNQEELYEALEKVLTELKAHTEYSTPFLQRVNKRDAPDYHTIIKQPMDMGNMTKKLKQLQYKSKAEFVFDLNLIWDNCLRYNQDLNSPLRRMANGMRKEAEKLIPLIPDLVIRPRAEVEAEERRKQNGGDDDGGDDSDDEPIMSSRGRIAGGAKGTKSRNPAPSDHKEGTPGGDQKPVLQLNGLLAKAHREGSEIDGSNGFATPPVGGSMTPSGANGHSGMASNADAMDIDGPTLNGMALGQALNEAAQQAFEDEEYKIWKQVTKKDRALVAKQRFQLFNGNKLNIDEPALLRTKADMRRFLRGRQQAEAIGAFGHTQGDTSAAVAKASETLAEGMEEDEEKVIPDYYMPQSVVPDIPSQLQWVEDNEGQVINQHEDFLKTVPAGYFTAPRSQLAQKFDANLRQMQETRKVCSKIGVIKQMQLQAQVYANQFPKYNPEPFQEADIEPHVICAHDDLVMAPEVCRAAMQRSVAKIVYHAGFEELQPSAIDTITDIAADFFGKVVHTFKSYTEIEKKDITAAKAHKGLKIEPRYSQEEAILHTLAENGYSVDALESYAKDEVDRLGNKLGGIHERMKSHLTDLLRPAVENGGQDGASAFHDGSEQFVGGDFAEELGEDFFGFKELGLAGELGGVLSVPLHLLQTRVRNSYTVQNPTQGPTDANLFEDLSPLDSVTKENIQAEIGLVKNFFLAKLHANGDLPLVEDEDLPVKQRRPRPRLGATGKIVSPQKRPPREQNAINKRKKKMEALAAEASKAGNNSSEKGFGKKNKTLSTPSGPTSLPPAAPAAPPMERMESQGNNSLTDKDDAGGMMSPESLER